MRFSNTLAVTAALASTVVAAPQPHGHHHHDAVTKAYVDDAAHKITHFVKHHVHKEWSKPSVVARDDAVEDLAVVTNPLDEPVVEVVLVMIEITEVVNKEHHKHKYGQGAVEVEPAPSVEGKIEEDGKVVPRGWWPFGKKGDDKNDAATPTPTVPWYKNPKYDILHVLDHTMTAGPMVTPTLAVITIPVINVQTKSKRGHTPTTLTKTNFVTTTVSQAPTETVDPRLDVWSKDEAIKAAVGTVEVMLGGAVFAGASAGATYVGKIAWNAAKNVVGKIW